MKSEERKPWYRHPWPWILMAGPAVVVVAGALTAIIAFQGADPLVADRAHVPARNAMAAP